jgi:hypothetical protein
MSLATVIRLYRPSTGRLCLAATTCAICSAMTELLSRPSSMNRMSITSPNRIRLKPGIVRYIST